MPVDPNLLASVFGPAAAQQPSIFFPAAPAAPVPVRSPAAPNIAAILGPQPAPPPPMALNPFATGPAPTRAPFVGGGDQYGYNYKNFPNSYQDPAYTAYEEQAAREVGIPVEMLTMIRTVGEKSNADQVSTLKVKGDGGRSPYQIIPSTRNAFLKKYGVDAYASPANAAKVAALHLKESMDRGGDPIKEYIGGTNPANHGQTTMKYTQRVKAALGGNLIPTPFDPSLYNPALNSIGQAEAAAMTPFSINSKRAEAPAMPELPAAPEKDFTRQDQLLAELAPKAFGEENATQLRRRRLWQGAAQALAGLEDGAGVGRILAQVGAGMLGGRLSADDEIQARTEEYDNAMREYTALKYKHEDAKADQKFAEATTAANAAFSRSMTNWQVKMGQWAKDNTITFQDGMLVTQSVNPDGTINTSGTPIASIIKPQYAMARAQIQGGIAEGQNAANAMDAKMVNSAVLEVATQEALAGDGTGAAMAFGSVANALVDAGGAPAIIGEKVWDQMTKDAEAYASNVAGVDGKSMAEIQHSYLVGQIAQMLGENSELMAAATQQAQYYTGMNDSKQQVKIKNGNTTITNTREQ